jgi:MinD-like ATPase involved in chromosome partitioning or flagellar assembly
VDREDVTRPQPSWLNDGAAAPADPWGQPWADLVPEPSPHQVTNQDLVADALLKRARAAPSRGWRRGLHRLTGGTLNPGESAGAARDAALLARIRQPIHGDYRIAFLSLKGGVGKTTTTIGLGSTFASLRGDCVIAVDANPDFGTLAQRVPIQTHSTVRDLIAAESTIRRYSDVRAHTSQAPSRLEVLASEQDPAISEAFSEDDYRRVIDILQVYYNIILTDCGTGIMHSAMNGVLQLANSLVLVSSPAIDGARSAAATLDWLPHHGYGYLVSRTVVVISAARPGSSMVDMTELTNHFLLRCRAVKVVPFDEHLAEGSVVDLDLLRPETRKAFVELAAMVADDFPESAGRHAVAEWR